MTDERRPQKRKKPKKPPGVGEALLQLGGIIAAEVGSAVGKAVAERVVAMLPAPPPGSIPPPKPDAKTDEVVDLVEKDGKWVPK